MDCTTISIHFGAAFFWCLTLIVSGSASFCTWHASRIYHEYHHERAMARGQQALLNQHLTPLSERRAAVRASPRPEAVRMMRLRAPDNPPEDLSVNRPGWRKVEGSFRAAAE